MASDASGLPAIRQYKLVAMALNKRAIRVQLLGDYMALILLILPEC